MGYSEKKNVQSCLEVKYILEFYLVKVAEKEWDKSATAAILKKVKKKQTNPETMIIKRNC